MRPRPSIRDLADFTVRTGTVGLVPVRRESVGSGAVSNLRLMLAPCAALVLAAGCGGSSSSSTSTGSGDQSSKAPGQILADMRSALAGVDSYHLDGSFTDKDGETRLAGDVAAPGSLRLKLEQGGNTVSMVIVGSQTYLRANRGFWKAQAGVSQPKVLKLLSDRWVKVPEASAADVRKLIAEFTPKNLGHCLTAQVGTISKRGTATVDGRKTVVLVDKGDRPGTSPGELYVAATGPTLPLRLRQTGPDRPGGRKDPRCGDSSDSTTKSGEVRFSRYGEPLHISPPPGALDLESLAQGNSDSTA